MGNVSNLVWVLPRPRPNHYPGGFPLYFERKLIGFLRLMPGSKILHPFGGKAEYGMRIDMDPSVGPDIIADAHALPFQDNVFDLVICDPPYTAELAEKIYHSSGPKFNKWTSEAVRVCKEFGFICLYHWLMLPRLGGTALRCRIVILQRTWGRPRVVTILQKNTGYHK